MIIIINTQNHQHNAHILEQRKITASLLTKKKQPLASFVVFYLLFLLFFLSFYEKSTEYGGTKDSSSIDSITNVIYSEIILSNS